MYIPTVLICLVGAEVSASGLKIRRSPIQISPNSKFNSTVLKNDQQIVDINTGACLGANQAGEILIKGDTVMLGYRNQPDVTAATIDRDGWLHSGDIGYYDEDGYFFVVDRIKELIKFNAYQVQVFI